MSGSRPRTPPKSSSLAPTDSPPQRPRGFMSTPPRKSYNRFFSESTSSWDSYRDLDVEEEDAVNLGEDEDEFGLPSLAGSYRQPAKRKTPSNSTMNLAKSISNKSAAGSEANLWRADSGDISDTRGLPNYPTAKPSEGKILRPQYKDVLRGQCPLVLDTDSRFNVCYRSCELPSPHQSSSNPSRLNKQGSRRLLSTHHSHK